MQRHIKANNVISGLSQLQYKPIPDAVRIEDDLVHCLLIQYLPWAVVDILECLEQNAGIAWVLDVQIRRLNDIIEERLHLSIAKVACGSVKAICAFLKEVADVVC